MQWRKHLKLIGVLAATGGGGILCWLAGYVWVSAGILVLGAVCGVVGTVWVRWLQKEEAIQLATISKEMFLNAIVKPECGQVQIDPTTGKVTYKAKPNK